MSPLIVFHQSVITGSYKQYPGSQLHHATHTPHSLRRKSIIGQLKTILYTLVFSKFNQSHIRTGSSQPEITIRCSQYGINRHGFLKLIIKRVFLCADIKLINTTAIGSAPQNITFQHQLFYNILAMLQLNGIFDRIILIPTSRQIIIEYPPPFCRHIQTARRHTNHCTINAEHGIKDSCRIMKNKAIVVLTTIIDTSGISTYPYNITSVHKKRINREMAEIALFQRGVGV